MSWTTPRTWTTGELVTKAILDTHVRDNLDYLKTQIDTVAGGVAATVTTTGTINNLAGLTFRSGVNITLRMNNASDSTITGVSGAVDGAVLTIVRVGAGNVFFSHESASSTAANRLINTLTSGNTPISSGGSAIYVYDGTTSRWRLIQHEQGSFITYTPTLTNITIGNGTRSGRYYVRGLDVRFDIGVTIGSTTTFGASPFTFSVPYANANTISNYPPGIAVGYHGGTGLSTGMIAINNAASAFSVNRVTDVESANGWDSGTPWGWTSGDSMSFSGVYTTS